MSARVLVWAWSVPVKGVRQHVLLALANSHNKDTGRCNPSMSELAELTGLGERTVRRAIGDLIADGVIVVENAGETGRATGGRRIRARYGFMVHVETRPERPPFANAHIIVTGPQRPPIAAETRPNGPPSESETRPNLQPNPAAVAPLSLRDKPGSEPGSTSDAAASGSEQAELFDAPPPKPSRALAVADRKAVAELNAGDAVGAWVDGYVATHDAKPTARQIGQVGRESRQLLEAGNPPARVVAAAKAAGERGMPMVERQYRDMSQRTGSAAPPAAARPSTTDLRVGAALALAAKYAEQEAG